MENYFDINLLKMGNELEFKKVYNYYEPRLNGFFYAKTSSEYLTADVIQQTFIKLWNNRTKLNPDLRLSTQIFQIAKNTMIDELRKETAMEKRKRYASASAQQAIDNQKCNNLEIKDLHVQIARIIEALPPMRKTVFLLSRDNDLSQKEISSMLSISVKTVNKHIQLALRQIRPYFTSMAIMVIFLLPHLW